jgi:hypothetical protein
MTTTLQIMSVAHPGSFFFAAYLPFPHPSLTPTEVLMTVTWTTMHIVSVAASLILRALVAHLPLSHPPLTPPFTPPPPAQRC